MKKSEIMSRAHALTRETIQPGDDYRATLGLCLRAAWEEYKTGAAQQPQPEKQPETLADFYRLPGEKQLQALRKFAARCPGYAQRQTRKDPATGERVPAPASWADWMIPRSKGGLELETWDNALDTIAAEAWTRLDRQPEDLPLQIILARACSAACQRLSNQYRDKPARSRADAVSLDDPDYSGAAHYPGPEAAAVQRETIRTAARSGQDRAILDMAAQGYTRPEIGRALGITRQAVEKHLAKMRARMEVEAVRAAADRLDAAVMAAAGVRRPCRPDWRPDNASTAPGQP